MAQLGIRLLNLSDINHYTRVPYVQMNEGQDFDVYFQLVDLSQVDMPPYVPGATTIAGSVGTVLYTGITSGSVISVVVAGIAFSQVYAVSVDNTVTLLAAQVNGDSHASKLATASLAAPGTLALAAPNGLGALGNCFALSASVSSGAGSATASGAFLAGGSGAGAAIMKVEVLNINDSKTVTRYASQPFAGVDASIWLVHLLSTDPIAAGTPNLRCTLMEGTKQSFVYSQGGVRVYGTTQNSTQPGAPVGPYGYAGEGSL